MSVELSNLIKLQEKGIPFDTFTKVMRLAEDFDFEETEDPAADFEAAIRMLNEEEALPSWLSEWCLIYGIDHKEMELEPPEDLFDI